MQAIVLRETGGPSKLHLEEFETPVAGPGEMLIAVHFAAFNRPLPHNAQPELH